jgi:putative DNA methylase
MGGARAGGARRKLIEAALPLEAIGRHVARHSAVSPLHLWWSRKPEPACRAVLFAALVDDPGEGLPEAEAGARRAALCDLVARLSAGEPAALAEARRYLAAAGAPPVVFDPFCGSGAIAAEAQRLGLPAWASDLNPVAVLATAALIDFPARLAGLPAVHRPDAPGGLAADVRWYGRWVEEEARRRIGARYPSAANGQPVIAWIWCRTARCPNPACGAELPLVHSFWLSRRPGREAWVAPLVDRETGTVRYAVGPGPGIPEPPPGTCGGRSAYCLVCEDAVPLEAVRRYGRQHGLGMRLLAIVAKGPRGRCYLPPDPGHERTALSVRPPWAPDTALPGRALGMLVAQYGLGRHRDLFSPRQLLALNTFSDLVREARQQVLARARAAGLPDDGVPLGRGGRGAQAYADAVATYLALALDRAAAKWSTLARWQRSRENVEHPFASPGLHMTWDFAEASPFSPGSGSWSDAVEAVAEALGRAPVQGPPGTWRQADAADPEGPPDGACLVCTDPPYFANLPYADTSDLFYVWLRRTLADVFPELCSTVLTPKAQELVADPYRHGGRAAARRHFREGLHRALVQIRRRAHPDYPVTLFYALRQTRPSGEDPGEAEGWVGMLEALLEADLQITATWPVRTEHPGRRRSLGSNALASSIVLVCRPRPADAPEASLREVLGQLRRRLPEAVAQLTAAGIAPVDLAQAVVGPGMEVFSRYRRVLAADGPVGVARALQLINRELDAILSRDEAELDPATRFCVAWFEEHGWAPGPYGEADVLARAKDTGLEALVRLGAVQARGGQVRLRRREELADGAGECAWLTLQGLVRALQDGGEEAAAALARRLAPRRRAALRSLTYRLYALAERQSRTEEARAYGGLAAAWEAIEEDSGGAGGIRG